MAEKVISFTQDSGSNLLTCKRALDDTVSNAQIFLPQQPIFEQECTAHVLQGACKAAVINVESDDKSVSIEKTRTRLQSCITWTKKKPQRPEVFVGGANPLQFAVSALANTSKNSFCVLIVAFR